MRERASRLWLSAEGRLFAAAARTDGLLVRLEGAVRPFRQPEKEAVAYAGDDAFVRRRIVESAALGFVGSILVFLGASLPASPFAQKIVPPLNGPYTPAWFFGAVRSGSVVQNAHYPPGPQFYVALIGFYLGVVLLIRAWLRLARLAREHPGVPLGLLAAVLALWLIPMLFVEPLLSKDAYDYVAQGEMVSRHINPYGYVPSILGAGANSYTKLTDTLWWYSTSPYGPGFLGLAGVIQVAVNHSELWALVAWRAVALAGVVLIAVFLPRLVRSFGRDPGPVFVFAVMNPIVVLHLVGGEHNDALMLGLLIAGLAVARERHPALGAALVACAALVKVPALLGVVYIGWDWAGVNAPTRRRIGSLAKAGAVALAVMAAVTQLVGFGWGWLGGLGNPDAVRSYLDPMTAIGLSLGGLARAFGDPALGHTLLTVARGAGAAAAIAIGVRLLLRSNGGTSSLRALGLTMLAVVILGPVMQPWYLAWGVILLAPVAGRRLRCALCWLTITVTFLGLGDVNFMVTELSRANALVVALASVGMLGVLLWPVTPKVRRSLIALHARQSGRPRREEALA